MHEHGHGTPEQKGYEISDVQVKIILIAGVGIVILTAFGYLVGTFATKYFRAQPPLGSYHPTPMALEEADKPWGLSTRLQVDPPRALVEFRGEQIRAANGFGVVSQEPEIYQIPVEAAMKIVAEKGLPQFPKVAAPAEGQAPQ